MFRGAKIPAVLLAIYLIAILGAFFIAPGGLIVLGFPWSILVVTFGWLIIHAGSGSVLDWALLLSTLPNLVVMSRWILMRYINESVSVD
jgi:hypothetical protein